MRLNDSAAAHEIGDGDSEVLGGVCDLRQGGNWDISQGENCEYKQGKDWDISQRVDL